MRRRRRRKRRRVVVVVVMVASTNWVSRVYVPGTLLFLCWLIYSSTCFMRESVLLASVPGEEKEIQKRKLTCPKSHSIQTQACLTPSLCSYLLSFFFFNCLPTVSWTTGLEFSLFQ